MPDKMNSSPHNRFEFRSAESLLETLEIGHVGLWEWNLLNGENIINDAWANMLGYTREEISPLTFKRFINLVHNDDRLRIQDTVQQHLDGHINTYSINFRMRKKDHRWAWIKAQGQITQYQGDEPWIMSGMHLDITEVMEKSEFLQNIANVVPGVIYQFEMDKDGHTRFPFASQKIRDILGITPEQASEDGALALQSIHPEDADTVIKSIKQSAQTGNEWLCEYRVYINGTCKWVHGRANPKRTEDGGILWHGLIIDISRLKSIEDKLRNQSITDSLTQWYNRRHFIQVATKSIERATRQQERIALIMFDIDHFKRVNDTYGHAKGDEVLCTLTDLFRKRLRNSDLPARLGGEEFVILLEGASLHDARKVAENLRILLQNTTFDQPGGSTFNVTSSFGVTELQDDDSLKDVLTRADKALYDAKHSGRNCTALA